MKSFIISSIITILTIYSFSAYSQNSPVVKEKTEVINAGTKSNAEQEKQAAQWVSSLHLEDKSKADHVQGLIADHLAIIRSWHNSHPYTMVPVGINPKTGEPLSKLDRQIIVDSTIPDSVHVNFMKGLRDYLNEKQVDAFLDQYTDGKVAFTMKGYKAIVPDLTQQEELAILNYLKQAREQAIDYKSMKEISAIFKIYKTKCQDYLNAHGRNWSALYKAYYEKMHSKK